MFTPLPPNSMLRIAHVDEQRPGLKSDEPNGNIELGGGGGGKIKPDGARRSLNCFLHQYDG